MGSCGGRSELDSVKVIAEMRVLDDEELVGGDTKDEERSLVVDLRVRRLGGIDIVAINEKKKKRVGRYLSYQGYGVRLMFT